MIQIDKGVPMPKRGATGRKAKYPWAQMLPGDSFFVPRRSSNGSNASKTSFPVIATTYGRKLHPGSSWSMEMATEKGVQGVRIWRRS